MGKSGRAAGTWRRWGTALAAALAIAGGMVVSGTRDPIAVAGDDPAPKPSPWRDPGLLEKRLSEACDAVEHVCGAKFGKRPTVKVGDRAEVANLLKAGLRETVDEGEQRLSELIEAAVGPISRSLLGYYESKEHRIHVMAENVEGLDSAAEGDGGPTEDLLRIVLAHEATHALDWPRFAFDEKQAAHGKRDARRALVAVAEGHAQWVAEQVAWTWGLTTEFRRFTKSMTDLSAIKDPAARRTAQAFVEEAAFAYVRGLTFMKALAKAGGRERIEAALKNPPDSTRWIEHPEEWIASGGKPAGQEPDLDAAVETFRFLVGDPAWAVVATRVTEALLKSQVSAVPEDKRADFLRGWVDGRVLVGMIPAEQRQVIAVVALFREEADAASFVAIERATIEAKEKSLKGGPITVEKVEVEEGAGPGGGLPGYVAHTVVAFGPKKTPTDSVAFWIGRIGVELVIVNSLEIDRKAQDAAVERVRAYLADPVAFAALPKPEPVPLTRTTRTLEVTLLGPDGQKVPKAIVHASDSEEMPSLGRRALVEDGVARLSLAKGAGWTLSVWGAADRRGDPLPLAPREQIPVPAEGDRMEVRLETGAEIRGAVVDEGGKPARGVGIEARPLVEGFARRAFLYDVVHGRARTAEDGTFRVIGLMPRERYALDLSTDGASAPEPAEATAGDTDVRLAFKAGLTVTLTIVDPDDKPVRGVHVSATDLAPMRAGGGRPGPPRSVQGSSDRNGKVVLKGLSPEGDYDVTFHVTDEDLTEPRWTGWKPADTRVRLERGWTATGVVLDRAGMPVAGVQVVRRTSENSTWSTTTDGEGRFEIRGLPVGPVSLWVEADRHGPSDEEEKNAVVVTQHKPEVELRYDRKPTVTIRVLDPDGKPVAKAEVWILAGSRGWSPSLVEGKASIDRPEGAFTVTVRGARSADGKALAPVVRSGVHADRPEIEIRLDEGRIIAGRVVDDNGNGVAGVHLLARSKEPGTAPIGRSEASGLTAVTGDDGSFRFDGLGDAAHGIVVTRAPAPWIPAASVDAKAGSTDVIVTLRKATPIRLVVLDPEGTPVPRAHVEVTAKRTDPEHGWLRPEKVFSGTTDDDGSVLLPPGDPAERLDVTGMPPPGREQEFGPIEEAWTPAKGESVRFPRAWIARGTVVDAWGKPAKANVVWVRGGGWGKMHRGGESGEDGSFRVGPLPEGAVRLAARPVEDRDLSYRSDIEWIDVDAKSPEVRLRLKGGPPLDLEVRIEGTKAGWFGTLQPEVTASRSIGLRFDDSGVARASAVPLGTYSLWVAPPEGETHVVWQTGIEVRGARVEARLTEGKPVKFRVTLPEKAQVDSVEVIGPLGYAIEAEDVGDGHYVVKALPPGTWTVKVRAYLGQKELKGTAAAVAGGEEVVVEPK